MGKKFNVKFLKACKICSAELPYRYRVYCSERCRAKEYNMRYKKERSDWQRRRNDKLHEMPSKDKIKCLICNRWYRQVGSHIVARHHMTAREYREEYGFDVKRGQLPKDFRKIKAAYVFENGTVNNLKKGAKFRFKKGDKRAGNYTRSQQTLERLKLGTKKLKQRTM